MPSDFERAIFGILSAMEGGQAQVARDRELLLKMQDRDLARRKELRDDRKVRLEEFETLGAPLEQLERGEELSRNPAYLGKFDPEGIRIGAEPTFEEQQAVSVYDKFLERMSGQRRSAVFDPETRQLIPAPRGVKILPGRAVAGRSGAGSSSSRRAEGPLDAAAGDQVRIRLPDGQMGTIPRANLERAKREFGAKEVR